MCKVATLHKLSPLASLTALFVMTVFAGVTNAELKPMGDMELSQQVGQAAIAFDVTEVDNTSQTRFTFGSTIDTQLNIDNFTLGEYENPASTSGADVEIANMSLGHISDAGAIVPFEARNPYFEIAEKNGELVGFRMGFDEARGSLSGDISTFSGNLGIKVIDGSGVERTPSLMDAENNATNYRATQLGVIVSPPPPEDPTPIAEQPAGPAVPSDPTFPDDPEMPADLAPPPVAPLPPRLVTTQLSEFKTLDVGELDANGVAQFTKDFFFSFQKEEVTWQGKSGSAPIQAGVGVHFNIPTSMVLTMPQFEAGVPRARTEYIDRGLGLF